MHEFPAIVETPTVQQMDDVLRQHDDKHNWTYSTSESGYGSEKKHKATLTIRLVGEGRLTTEAISNLYRKFDHFMSMIPSEAQAILYGEDE